MIYFNLTPQQKKQFNKLKAAYRACEKAGIIFVNNYGALEAYDKAIVAGYADKSTYDKASPDVISTHESYCSDSLNIANEWTDDEHLIKLTPKGKKELM